MSAPVTPEMIRRLAAFDTCTLANAIETFGVRLRNEGYTDSTLLWRSEELPPMVGLAVTLRVRSAEPSMKEGFYLDRSDWWERLEAGTKGLPRILVLEDMDSGPARGALVGPVHACILAALGCVGVITNGAVRGIDRMAHLHLRVLSGSLSPSHAYGHVVASGQAVQVAGLSIEPGTLLHGDRHGVISIPGDIVARLPEVAARFRGREERTCRFCAGEAFSPSDLRRFIESDSKRG